MHHEAMKTVQTDSERRKPLLSNDVNIKEIQ